MNWSFHTTGGTALTSLTNNENPTLIQVLEDPNLTNALRIPPAQLLDFLSNPEVLGELFDWVLTTNFTSLPTAGRSTRQALAILTSPAKPIQRRLFTQEVTISRLNGFPESDFASHPQICGHFQRVVEAFLQSNPSKGIAQLPSLTGFLTSRLSCLGLRELFINFVTNDGLGSEATSALFSSLLSDLSGPNAYFVVTALHTILRKSDPDILPRLQSPDIVSRLLDASVATSATYDALIASECFQIVERILQSGNSDLSALVASRASEFRVADRPVDCSLAFCARVFPAELPGLVERVFAKPANTFLNAAIVDAFFKAIV
jgi:hypothetical protein